MCLKKGTKIDRGYATIATDQGINYREIADTMTELGFPMNHSSARNYIVRVMRKFVDAYAKEYGVNFDLDKIDQIAKSPHFQQGIAEILEVIESKRRNVASC